MTALNRSDALRLAARLVMVDVAALRAKALWTERAVSIVDACAVPIIWIDEAKAEPPPRRKQFFPLSRPVSRDALRQALAQCLEEPDRPKPNATTSAKPSGAAQTRSTATSGESHIAGDARTYIDLVDIVEVSSKAEDAKALRQ